MRKKKIEIKFLNHFRKYWLQDTSFFTSFLLLLFFIFFLPIITEYVEHSQIFIKIGLLALYTTGIFSCYSRSLRIFLILLFVIIFTLKIIRFFFDGAFYYSAELIFSIINVILMIFLNLRLLFRDGEINLFRVLGAINVYLLMAVFGTLFLMLLDIYIHPVLSGNVNLQQNDKDFSVFIYYTLVSLTTVGYGDIYSTHVIVKQLSIALSTFGILYPSVVIAKLVNSGS
jgi:hypothetical protein